MLDEFAWQFNQLSISTRHKRLVSCCLAKSHPAGLLSAASI